MKSSVLEKESPDRGLHLSEKIITQKDLQDNEQFFQQVTAYGGEFFLIRFTKDGTLVDPWTGKNEIPLNENLYYTVNPRFRYNGNGQGKKEDIRYATAFFADIDYGKEGHKKPSKYKTREEALRAIDSFPLLPTYIVHTGHGYQCLWLFKEQIEIGKDIRLEEYETINRNIQVAIGADTTPDITRLLRLPGSNNMKNPANPVPAEIVKNNDVQYALGDFEMFETDEMMAFDEEIDDDSPVLNLSRLEKVYTKKLSEHLQRLLKEGIDSEDPNQKDRSVLIHRCVFGLVAKGYSDDEIYTLLTDPKNKLSEKLREMESDRARERYISLSLNKARKKRKEIESTREKSVDELEVLGIEGVNIIFRFNGHLLKLSPNEVNRRMLKLLTGVDFGSEAEQYLNHIIDTARSKGYIDTTDTVGNGVWHFGDKAYVISGNNFLEIGEEIKAKSEPVVDGHFVIQEKEWLDIADFEEAYKTQTIKSIYEKIYDIVRLWNWKDPNAADFMTAFLMIAPFQQAMTWRPWIYILGARSTGKTTFFADCLGGLYPDLVQRMDKSTAYAIAQTIGNTGNILVLDEFEKDKKILEILEVLKLSNKGQKKTSGSTGPKALGFNFFHIPFLGSIYAQGEDSAQKTRMVIFELNTHDNKGLKLPSKKELKQWGAQSIGVMLRNWELISEKANAYREHPDTFGIGGRVVDNFAYAKAVTVLSQCGRPASTDGGVLLEQAKEVIVDDGLNILDAILTHMTKIKSNDIPYNELNVAQALVTQPKALETYGLKIVGERASHVAFNPDIIQQQLLRDTRYAGLDIRKPLQRIEGAIASKNARMAGLGSQKCVWIPLEVVLPDDDEEESA